MRVLGVDPGLTTTGIAVIERSGGKLRPVHMDAVRTAASAPVPARLFHLWQGVSQVIEHHGPDVVAIERLFFNSNVKTAMSVGQACGVILATAGGAGLTVTEYTPPEVKQAVVGVGSASKEQVQAMVATLLSLGTPPTPSDVADACALAICHLNRSGLASALMQQVAR